MGRSLTQAFLNLWGDIPGNSHLLESDMSVQGISQKPAFYKSEHILKDKPKKKPSKCNFFWENQHKCFIFEWNVLSEVEENSK